MLIKQYIRARIAWNIAGLLILSLAFLGDTHAGQRVKPNKYYTTQPPRVCVTHQPETMPNVINQSV